MLSPETKTMWEQHHDVLRNFKINVFHLVVSCRDCPLSLGSLWISNCLIPRQDFELTAMAVIGHWVVSFFLAYLCPSASATWTHMEFILSRGLPRSNLVACNGRDELLVSRSQEVGTSYWCKFWKLQLLVVPMKNSCSGIMQQRQNTTVCFVQLSYVY